MPNNLFTPSEITDALTLLQKMKNKFDKNPAAGYETYVPLLPSDGHLLDVIHKAVSMQQPLQPNFQWEKTYLCPPDCGGEEFDEWGWQAHCPTCNRPIDHLTTRCQCGQSIVIKKNYPKEPLEEA